MKVNVLGRSSTIAGRDHRLLIMLKANSTLIVDFLGVRLKLAARLHQLNYKLTINFKSVYSLMEVLRLFPLFQDK